MHSWWWLGANAQCLSVSGNRPPRPRQGMHAKHILESSLVQYCLVQSIVQGRGVPSASVSSSNGGSAPACITLPCGTGETAKLDKSMISASVLSPSLLRTPVATPACMRQPFIQVAILCHSTDALPLYCEEAVGYNCNGEVRTWAVSCLRAGLRVCRTVCACMERRKTRFVARFNECEHIWAVLHHGLQMGAGGRFQNDRIDVVHDHL